MEQNNQVTTKEDFLKACDELRLALREYFSDADNMPAVERNKVYAAIRHRALDIRPMMDTKLADGELGSTILGEYLETYVKANISTEERDRFIAVGIKSTVSQLVDEPITHKIADELGVLSAMEWLLLFPTESGRLPLLQAVHVLSSPLSYHLDTKLRNAICVSTMAGITDSNQVLYELAQFGPALNKLLKRAATASQRVW